MDERCIADSATAVAALGIAVSVTAGMAVSVVAAENVGSCIEGPCSGSNRYDFGSVGSVLFNSSGSVR